jgi:hypothetical protein
MPISYPDQFVDQTCDNLLIAGSLKNLTINLLKYQTNIVESYLSGFVCAVRNRQHSTRSGLIKAITRSHNTVSYLKYDLFVPLMTIYNGSRQPVQFYVTKCDPNLASVLSDVNYQIGALINLMPGRKLLVEESRIDQGQLERYSSAFGVRTYFQRSVAHKTRLSVSHGTNADAQYAVVPVYVRTKLQDIYGLVRASFGVGSFTGSYVAAQRSSYHNNGSLLGGLFIQIQSLINDDIFKNITPCEFGFSIAMPDDGSVILIGAPGRVFNSGCVYLFTRNGASYTQTQFITGSDTQSNDRFGADINISADGSVFIVSAPQVNTQAGQLYVFNKSGSAYNQIQQIFESSFDEYSQFGFNISFSRDKSTLVVGAPLKKISGQSVGSISIYRLSFGTYILSQVITGADMDTPTNGMAFGHSVDYNDEYGYVAVGAPGYNGSGRVYVFKDNGTFDLISVLDDGASSFGSSLAFADEELFIGASNANGGNGEMRRYTVASGDVISYADDFLGGVGDGLGVFMSHTLAADNLFVSGSKDGGFVDAYGYQDDSYSFLQRLTPFGLQVGDNFGCFSAVTADGSYLAVGASTSDIDGKVFIFKKGSF